MLPARAARPSEPVTVQRRASNTGVIMVVGQKIALGRIQAGQIVTVHVADQTMAIDLGDDDTRTICRTTTQPVRSFKGQRSSNFNRSVLRRAYVAAGWRDDDGNGRWTWHSLRHVFCRACARTPAVEPTPAYRDLTDRPG